MVKMCAGLLLIFIHLTIISADSDLSSCNINKCYQTVNKSYENLLHLINRLDSTSSEAEIQKNYDIQQLKDDISDVNNIEKEVQNAKAKLESDANRVNRTDKNTSNKQKIVDRLLEQVSNVSQYDANVTNMLNEAKRHHKKLETLIDLGENASQTCQQAHHKYTEFKTIIDDAIRKYEDLSKKYNNVNREAKKLNSDIKNTFQETVKTKNEFEQLTLPTSLGDNYLLRLENNFTKSINTLKNNVKRLKHLLRVSQRKWNKQLENRATEVAKNISQIESDLNKMNEQLKKYEQAFEKPGSFNSTVNNESRNLLRTISTELEKLENDLKSINFTEEEKEWLLDTKDDERNIDELRKKRVLIKEYKIIIDTLLEGINVTDIRKQIDHFKIIISLIEEWKKLDNELRRLRANRDAILKIECTTGSNILT